MSYEIGNVYTFKVKKRFTSQTELIDEATQVTTYLHNTEKLNLPRGLEVKCKVTMINGERPIVELVDLEDFKFTSGLTREKLSSLLKERDYGWDATQFADLILAEDNEETFESQCYNWLDDIRKTHNLETIRENCADLLELSGFLDLCGPAQREYYQERLTVLIEIIGYYITAAKKIEDGNTADFIEKLFRKLSISGFVYHPDKNFSILASIFMLKPEIMSECIGELLEIIRKRDISTWKKEPFNTALTRLLEMYIRVSIYTIDRKKEPQKSETIRNCINALAIQLSLVGGRESTVIDPRIAAARLCSVSTYINPQNVEKLLDNAYSYLFNDDVHLLNFSYTDIERLPYIMANHDPGGCFESSNFFSFINSKLTVDKRGISLSPADSPAADSPVFPPKFKLWKNLQVYLESKLTKALPSTPSKNLKPYEDAWTAIESDLFRPKSTGSGENNARQHRTGDNVQIKFVRVDTNDSQKFYCRIVDEIGGDGYIFVKPDIVPYTVYSPQLTTFFGKIFNAEIIGRDNDGNFHFSMSADVKAFVGESFQYDDQIICWLGMAPNRTNRLAPAVEKEGASVTVEVPKELMGIGLGQGSIVRARVIRSATIDKASHLYAEAIEQAGPLEDVIVSEAFSSLMQAVGFDYDCENDEPEYTETPDAEEIVKELDEDYIKQVIFCIDRLAMIDPDYVKSYNLLWFCDLMSRMIGRHDFSVYYQGRIGIISMLHYFAKNNSLDEEELSRFEISNSDLLSNNSPLRERFLQLQAVSYIDKPDHDKDLEEMADKYPTLRPLARLVIAYNIVKEAGMSENADDIHNKIKQLLNLKGFDSNLKYYGQEGIDKEFKTSIVTPAGEKHPNFDKQINEILNVINSFLNTNGGTLYVGVNDSGMGSGVEADLASPLFNHDKDKYLRAITDAVAMRWGNYIATFVSAQFDAENPRKDVMTVTVKPHPTGVKMSDGRYLVRIDSTKRGLSPEEFELYASQNRNIDFSDTAEEDNEQIIENETEKKENSNDEKINHSSDSDRLNTGRIRKNVFEDWHENYIQPIALLKFLENEEFSKIDEFDYDYETLLTLTVLDDEQDAFLIMGYDNGRVARVPVDDILRFDSGIRRRYAGAKLIFASIGHRDDLVLTIMRENKTNGKKVMRADRVDSFEEGNLQHPGQAPCNESLIGEILAYDIIPHALADEFEGIVGLDDTKCGHSSNNKTRPIVEKLHNFGITEI